MEKQDFLLIQAWTRIFIFITFPLLSFFSISLNRKYKSQQRGKQHQQPVFLCKVVWCHLKINNKLQGLRVQLAILKDTKQWTLSKYLLRSSRYSAFGIVIIFLCKEWQRWVWRDKLGNKLLQTKYVSSNLVRCPLSKELDFQSVKCLPTNTFHIHKTINLFSTMKAS